MIKKSFTFEGKRYYVRGETEREVYEKIAIRKRDLEEGRVVITGNMRVKEWIDRVLEVYKPNVSEEYLEQMKLRIRKHIVSEIGSYPVKSIRPLQCQAILNRQKGCSKSHIDKLYHELFFIFEKAKSNHLILENPAADLEKPEGYKKPMRSLTEYEREHWLSIMDDDPRFMLFQLMYYCGCRPGEAAGVLRSDLRRTGDFYQLHIRGTKTENSDRYVPVPLDLLYKIKRMPSDRLIAPNNAGQMHTESSYNRLVKSLKRSLNISMGCKVYRNQLIPPYPLAEDFVPYMFRHTYCTDLQKKGVDIRIAKDLMGHADISTTANIYTHQDEDTIGCAAQLLGCSLSTELSKNVATLSATP